MNPVWTFAAPRTRRGTKPCLGRLTAWLRRRRNHVALVPLPARLVPGPDPAGAPVVSRLVPLPAAGRLCGRPARSRQAAAAAAGWQGAGGERGRAGGLRSGRGRERQSGQWAGWTGGAGADTTIYMVGSVRLQQGAGWTGGAGADIPLFLSLFPPFSLAHPLSLSLSVSILFLFLLLLVCF